MVMKCSTWNISHNSRRQEAPREIPTVCSTWNILRCQPFRLLPHDDLSACQAKYVPRGTLIAFQIPQPLPPDLFRRFLFIVLFHLEQIPSCVPRGTFLLKSVPATYANRF